jgi:hypothetical protein
VISSKRFADCGNHLAAQASKLDQVGLMAYSLSYALREQSGYNQGMQPARVMA